MYYYWLFRWFPKKSLTHLMGVLASIPAPQFLLAPLIHLYSAIYRIDMSQFVVPEGGYRTFNGFFARGVKPGARPIAADPGALISPVDGRVTECGAIHAGRLFQAKGMDYSLSELLGGAPGWEAYDGGVALTLYLSPRDYHRIHSPCAGEVTRFAYIPGELWTVGPMGFHGVPGLFSRNERLVTWIDTGFGEVALVAVGATVVGRIKAVYHPLADKRARTHGCSAPLTPPHPLEKGGELGRFELGSTVILLCRPEEAEFSPFQSGDRVRMGQAIGTFATRKGTGTAARNGTGTATSEPS